MLLRSANRARARFQFSDLLDHKFVGFVRPFLTGCSASRNNVCRLNAVINGIHHAQFVQFSYKEAEIEVPRPLCILHISSSSPASAVPGPLDCCLRTSQSDIFQSLSKFHFWTTFFLQSFTIFSLIFADFYAKCKSIKKLDGFIETL